MTNYNVTEAEVRTLGAFTATELPTSTITDIIVLACKELNARINRLIEDEPMLGTDDNTKFFVQHPPIGDMNDSLTVSTSSVIVCDDIPTELDRVTQTVSAINARLGLVTLSAAQSGSMYCTYVHVGRDVSTPDPLVHMAALHVAIAMCWDYVHRTTTNMRLADISVSQVNRFWEKAKNNIADINAGQKLDYGRRNQLKDVSQL